MVRLGLIVMVLVLTGCSALGDAFSGDPQVAGTAAGQTLTVDRLANMVGRAQRIPVRPDVVTGVANVYLDYAVFATELGRGRDLHDSALVLATQWPVAAQLKWEHYHDQLIATRGKLTPAQADSAFQAGTVRLFQHILIRIPQSAVPMVEQQKEKEASAVLMQAAARRGFNFAQLARRYSEDPGSKSKGGYLPATPRGQFVPAFDSAAWTLPPGAMTAVVRTPFGFHIIRRPPLAEVRDSFRVDLENSRTAQLDSLYLDSLANQRPLKLEAGAPALVRQAAPALRARLGCRAARGPAGRLAPAPQGLRRNPRRARAARHGARRPVRGPGGDPGHRTVLPSPALPGRRAPPGPAVVGQRGGNRAGAEERTGDPGGGHDGARARAHGFEAGAWPAACRGGERRPAGAALTCVPSF